MRHVALLVCFAIVFGGVPALAEPPTFESGEGLRSLEFLLADASEPGGSSDEALRERIAELEREKAAIGFAGPRAAMIAGGAFMLIGGVLAGVTAIACQQANTSTTRCNDSLATSLEIGGGAVAGAGLLSLISGWVVSSQRSAKRNELGQEIRRLKQQESRLLDNLQAQVSLGETKGLTLTWVF